MSNVSAVASEDLLVAIGRAVEHDHRVARLDLLAADLDVFGGLRAPCG